MKDTEEKTVCGTEDCDHDCDYDCENCQIPCDDEDSENLISLTDEDGNEVVFEWLDVVEYEGESYGVFIPVEEETDDVVILHISEGADGDDVFEGIEDDEFVMKLFDLFKENNKDRFTFKD